MLKPQKARYLVSKRFIELGATAVRDLSIDTTKFVTITSTIWAAVEQMLAQSDPFLAEVLAGYERQEYIGSQPFHLARDTRQTKQLWSLTQRLITIREGKIAHFDAIVCALLGTTDDSLSERPLPTRSGEW